jgi:hypothetical protein
MKEAMRVSQMAIPVLALLMASILAFARKKTTTSIMKAMKATEAAIPENRDPTHGIHMPGTWARSPKKVDAPAATSATTWRTKRVVIHFTKTCGIWIGSEFPTNPLISISKKNEIRLFQE